MKCPVLVRIEQLGSAVIITSKSPGYVIVLCGLSLLAMRGPLFVVVRGLLCGGSSHCSGVSYCRARALGKLQSLQHASSVVVAHGLSCSGMWNRPRSGIEPLTPALAGGFLSSASPGKSTPAVSML